MIKLSDISKIEIIPMKRCYSLHITLLHGEKVIVGRYGTRLEAQAALYDKVLDNLSDSGNC